MCSIIPQHLYNNLLVNGNDEEKSLASEAIQAIKSFVYSPAAILAKHFRILSELEAEEEVVDRHVYDAQYRRELPGKLVRSEGQISNGDVAVDEAYEGSGKTFDFFMNIFKRNSIDDKGMRLKSTVHFGKNYANAFWNGEQMTYGDGDGKIFNRFSSVLDVIGHEISHGVTERTAGLIYEYQPGALNEHFSDVFGALLKQYDLKQTADKADWLIGAGLFTKNINAVALRSMKAPGTAYNDPRIGKDPQPDHMSRYVETESDNGGVHINSSIPNKAFYHTAMNIGGFSYDRAGQIWYRTLTTKLKSNTQFQGAANATVKVAEELYGTNSVEQKAVIDGWKQVGIKAVA